MTELNQIISGRSVIVMQNKVSWFFNKALKKVEDSNKSLFNLGCTEALITAIILGESLGVTLFYGNTSMVIAESYLWIIDCISKYVKFLYCTCTKISVSTR